MEKMASNDLSLKSDHTKWNIHLSSSRNKRKNLTDSQLSELKEYFEHTPMPTKEQRLELAQRFPDMTERSLQIWFQNRRSKLNMTQIKRKGQLQKDSETFNNNLFVFKATPPSSSSSSNKAKKSHNRSYSNDQFQQDERDHNSTTSSFLSPSNSSISSANSMCSSPSCSPSSYMELKSCNSDNKLSLLSHFSLSGCSLLNISQPSHFLNLSIKTDDVDYTQQQQQPHDLQVRTTDVMSVKFLVI